MNKIVVLFLSLLIMIHLGCGNKQTEPSLSKDKARDYANELYNRQLFRQSAAEYERYLNNYNLDKTEQANISYTIGDVYFDRLRDYENALTFYIRAKYFNPKEELRREIDKKIVACLERLNRTEDAKQTIQEATSLEPESVQKKRPGAVVARIGTREISQGDIDFELSQLHPSVRSQYTRKEKKLEFLNQYILTELLYNSAKNMGIENDNEVIEAAFQAKKNIMVQKYLQDQIVKEVKIVPEDVELYYKANKEKYVEKDKEGNVVREKSLAEVQQQAAQDLLIERQQEAYRRTAERLMRAEGVQIYDDVLK
jgi:tetratricopeptide (TPR) repeat protein